MLITKAKLQYEAIVGEQNPPNLIDTNDQDNLDINLPYEEDIEILDYVEPEPEACQVE